MMTVADHDNHDNLGLGTRMIAGQFSLGNQRWEIYHGLEYVHTLRTYILAGTRTGNLALPP